MSEAYINHHLRGWLNSGKDVYTVIDAGMGFGKVGFMLRLNFPNIAMNIYGYDIFEKGITFSKNLGTAYHKVEILNIESSPIPHEDQSVDIGLCVGVLGHLVKKGGRHLLRELKRTCKRVIVTAPTTLYQHTNILNDPHIEPLRHKSKWSVGDLKDEGFEVRGFELRGRTNKVTYLDYVLSPWVFRFPSFSGGLVAWTPGSG
jgi:SAM-dependent methyltransferase